MKGSSFDRLARMISADASRRGALRSAFVAALAGLGGRSLLGAEDAEAKSCQKRCKKKKNKNARKQCLKRCNASQGQGKAAGATPQASAPIPTSAASPSMTVAETSDAVRPPAPRAV